METVLSDCPSLPSQARLLCSADAAVLYRCFSLQCSKSLPQLPGCMFSGPGAVLVWSDPFHMVVPVFIPGVWCGVVWCGASANSKSELCSPTCTMCCFSSLGSVQLSFPGGNRQDVRRFGNAASLENY